MPVYDIAMRSNTITKHKNTKTKLDKRTYRSGNRVKQQQVKVI